MFADIRIGYIVVPEALIEIFELAQRHLGLLASVTIQDALAEFIGAGAYLAHIRRVTRLYKGRRDRMLQALASEAGDRLTIDAPPGGMQLLARCVTASNDRRLSDLSLVRFDVVIAGFYDRRIGLFEKAPLISVIEHEWSIVPNRSQHHRRDAIRRIERKGVVLEGSFGDVDLARFRPSEASGPIAWA